MTKRVAWIAAGIVFIIHALANPHYGFFRDELYFIICGQHPQFGYVDQPPVVPLLSALTQLGGHSLFLLRLVPALCSAAGAFVTVLLAAEFGGGLFAQIFAVFVYACTGVLTNFGMKVSPDEIGLWSWPLIAYFVVRLTKGADPRLWLAGRPCRRYFAAKQIRGDLLPRCIVDRLAAHAATFGLIQSLVRDGRRARHADCVAKLPLASPLRFSDVGTTAQRTKRQERNRRSARFISCKSS